jgi:hypothetical protein
MWASYNQFRRLRSATNISFEAEWVHRGGRAQSAPSETPRCWITWRPASIQHIAFHIAPWSLFVHFMSFCQSSILTNQSAVVANYDHILEWDYWVWACIGTALLWVTLRKSLLAFLLPASKVQFSLYWLDTIARRWVTLRKSLLTFLLPSCKIQFSLY